MKRALALALAALTAASPAGAVPARASAAPARPAAAVRAWRPALRPGLSGSRLPGAAPAARGGVLPIRELSALPARTAALPSSSARRMPPSALAAAGSARGAAPSPNEPPDRVRSRSQEAWEGASGGRRLAAGSDEPEGPGSARPRAGLRPSSRHRLAAAAVAGAAVFAGAAAPVPSAALPAASPSAFAAGWLGQAAPALEILAVLAGTYAAGRAARWAADAVSRRAGWSPTGAAAARYAATVFAWTAGAALGLHLAGVGQEVIMATFGAGGTALTLAVRDILGNMVHGANFLLSRPYSVGDRIQVGRTEGTVHSLGLRYLTLAVPEGGFALYTYSSLAGKAVTLLGPYRQARQRAALSGLEFPRGALGAALDAATARLLKPAAFAALALGAAWAAPALASWAAAAGIPWLAAALPWARAAAFLAAAGFLLSAVSLAADRLAVLYGWRPAAVTWLKLAFAAAFWGAGVSAALGGLGVSWTSLAAGLSISVIVVGVAVNDYVSAAFQGGLLFFTRPFVIGDAIRIGEHEGEVVDITLQHVVLKKGENAFVLVPHALAKDAELRTPRDPQRRIRP